MSIYFRFLFVLIAIPILFEVVLFSRNEIACLDSSASSNIEYVRTVYTDLLRERKNLYAHQYGAVKCSVSDIRGLEFLIKSGLSLYITCSLQDENFIYEQSIFVLSRCGYVKEEEFPADDLPIALKQVG